MSPKVKKAGQYSLLALVLCILLLNWLLDANRYKEQIQQLIQQQVKQPVSIGQIQHSLFSPSHLTLEGFVLGETQQPLLSLQSLQLELALWPLLQKHVVVENLVFDGLDIDISDTDLAALAAEDKPKADPPPESVVLPIDLLLLKNLAINNLNIQWHSAGQSLKLAKANLALWQVLLVEDGQLLSDRSSAQLHLDIRQLNYNNLLLDKITLASQLAQQKLELKELQAELLSGQVMVGAEVDLARDFATSLYLSLKGIQLQLTPEWLEELVPQPSPTVAESTGEQSNALPVSSLLLTSVDVSDSQFYSNLSPQVISAEQVQLQLKNLQLIKDHQLSVSQPELVAEFNAQLQQLVVDTHPVDNLTVSGQLQQQLQIDNFSVVAPGVELQLKGQASLADTALPLSVETQKASFRFNEQNKHWFAGELPWPEGELNAELQLSAAALADNPLGSLTGALALSSKDMQLHKLNLNGILAGLEQTEKTSLLDVGSFLVTGPLGLIASQVANLGQAGLTAQEGSSVLKQLELNMAVDKGILTTGDVALSTDEYRVALDGKIDLAQRQFDDLKFYILDQKGCADIQQTLNGPMDSPDGIFSQAVSTTVLKPFSNILSQAGSLLTECKPVYQGKVAAPQG